MGNKQNFIEINGKKYDAQTGVQIKDFATTDQTTHTVATQQSHMHQKPVLDGFVRAPKSALRQSYASSVKSPDVTPQKAKTLARAAVKKPAHLIKALPHDINKAKHIGAHPSVTLRTATPTQHRQQLAHTVQKSTLVQKFGPTASNSSKQVAKLTELSVQPAPVLSDSTLRHNRTNKTSDLLEKALEAAKGHNEPYYQHKQSRIQKIAKKLGISGRATAITTAVLAGLLLGGFYAYQNVPNLAMKVASTRAGINAGMPSYSPAGFGFSGPVQYSAGQVVISFKSNSDDRNYRITQQATNWSSDSLLNNFVVASNKQYQTYQDRGKTIYTYDGSSATWVNAGVWYQIDGKSDLTSDQLVRIAASL